MSLNEFLSGTLFGSALLASGVSSPSVITSQLTLQNTHMLQSFISASSISALVVALAAKTGIAPCRVRSPLNYGYFPYDANLFGGLLIGAGMASTGACPGTVLAQIASGISSGRWVGLGALIGGVCYTGFAPYLRRNTTASTAEASAKGSASQTQSSEKSTSEAPRKETLQSLFNLSTPALLLLYEVMCAGMILAIQAFAPPHFSGRPMHPIAGGLLIGAAQAMTVLLTRRTVGVSAVYQDLGRRFWSALDSASFPAAKLLTPAVTFACGILAGSWMLTNSGIVSFPAETVVIEPWKAVIGGAYMVFGAGLAGGCPSGHGISGMATFSISSFVSVAGMFGGGIAVAKVLELLI